MQLSEKTEEKLTELIQPLVENSGLELIDICWKQENKNNILGIFIDKGGGITVDECAAISREISLVLDVEELIPATYRLEVGSPGIFRELKSEKEFLRNTNARVKAVFRSPIAGQKKFIGTLARFENQVVYLRNAKQELSANLSQIKKIQLYPEF